MNVCFKTSNGETGTWNLLSPENLRRVGKKKWRDIKLIDTFFHTPGGLYIEPGISKTRPYGGSFGVWIYTATQSASIQSKINYDYNEKKDHYCGLHHWNHDNRFIDVHGNVIDDIRAEKHHIIKASSEIEITFFNEKRTITADAHPGTF